MPEANRLSQASAALKSEQESSPDRRMVGVEGGSVYSALSPWTLRAYAYSGKIASYKIGSRLLFDLKDLDMLLESGRRPARDEDAA